MLINRSAHLVHADGTRTCAKLIDLSLTGGLLHTSNSDTPKEEGISNLELETNARIPVEQHWNRKAGLIALKFGELEILTKKKLVGYAFSGEFKSAEQPQKVEFTKTLRQIIGEVTRSS